MPPAIKSTDKSNGHAHNHNKTHNNTLTHNNTHNTNTHTHNNTNNNTHNNTLNLHRQIFTLIFLYSAISIQASASHHHYTAAPHHHRPIRISRHNDTSISVSWLRFANQKRLRRFSCGVEYFKVKLRFNDKTVQNWQVVNELTSLQIDDPYLKELKAVQVRALMCDRDTVYKTSWIKINSSDHLRTKNLLEPPTSFNVVSIENNVLVRWKANLEKANIEGFIVSYGERVPDIMFKYVSRNQKNVTLEKLKHSTLYVVGIRTFYKHLQSQALYKSIKTKDKPSFGLGLPRSEASSLPAPTQLRLKTLSSRSIELEWKDPSLYGDQRIIDERFYVVHYTNMKSQQNTSIIVKALHVTIHNLQADCWYIFRVRIGKGALSSPYTDGIPGKTLKMDFKNRGLLRGPEKVKRKKKQQREAKERKLKRHQRNHKAHRMPFKSHHPYHHPSFNKPPLSLQKRQIINMKRKLHFSIGAFVTWPRSLHTICASSSNNSSDTSANINAPNNPTTTKPLYAFRYKRSDEKSYVETNLSENFRYINDLSARHSYIYQVKYLHPGDQGWSQEEVLEFPK